MDSIDFLFDCDFQKKYDSESVVKDLKLFEDNRVLVENEMFNDLKQKFVVNDVFLNQNNHLFDSIINNYEKKFTEEESDSYEDFEDERESGFESFLDHICGQQSVDSLANESLFGCICCHSCQIKSQHFMSKTNQMIEHFRRQIKDFKENVRQHLREFNNQINTARLEFTRVINNLELKLNEKNDQLERILSLGQFLSNNNDLLLNQSKVESLKFENVCKENIKYRNQLGIELKVILNSEECKNAIKMYETFKLKDKNRLTVNNCEDKSPNNSCISENMSQTSPQTFNSFKQLSPLNDTQNNYDLEKRIRDLFEKYETIPSNNKKRRITSPKKYENFDTNVSERKRSERLKEHKNNSQINLIKYPEKLLQNNIHKKLNNFSLALTPITTYSKSGSTHTPLLLNKSSQQSINTYSKHNQNNNNQNNNNHHIFYGLHYENNSMNKVYDNMFHNSNGILLNRLPNNDSKESNEFIEFKSEPQFPQTSDNNLVKIESDNGVKIEISIPKGIKRAKKKRGPFESRRFCKRCNKEFPSLTTREYNDHIYNVCPARECADKSLIKCDLCPREFLNTSALTSHRRSKHLKVMAKDSLVSNTVSNFDKLK